MRVSVTTPNGSVYMIDSLNTGVIGEWLSEYLAAMNDDPARAEWNIQVWAMTKREGEVMGPKFLYDEMLTEQGLRKIEELFRRMRENWFPPKKPGGQTRPGKVESRKEREV